MVSVWAIIWSMGFSPLWLGTKPPEVHRIVSLAPSATEIICALGACRNIVGITRYDTYPPEIATLPKVGGFVDPDIEAIVALKPDLVVAIPTSGGRSRIDALSRLGLTILILPAEHLDDLWICLTVLGDVLKKNQAAEQLATKLRLEMAALKQNQGTAVRALLVVGRRPLIAAGAGTYLDSLLSLLNASNVITRGGAYPELDAEAVAALDPDVIVDVSMGDGEQFEAYWSKFPLIRAVAQHRIRALNTDTVLRPGPRIIEGMNKLAQALRETHP